MASSSAASTGVHLTKEEEKEFREIFNLVDRDKGGSISKAELAQLMDTLQINASQQEIDLMIGEIDKDGDGEIQFEVRTTSKQLARAPACSSKPFATMTLNRSCALFVFALLCL